MVIAAVSIRPIPEKSEELRRGLSSLSGPTRAEVGCMSCQLYLGLSDPGVLRVESRWTTEAELVRHIRSDTFKKLLFLMELGSERPTVEFLMVSEVRCLDFVTEVREINPEPPPTFGELSA
jgi:quinol monooxygenase YgiN